MAGSLIAVGTGIKSVSHITFETASYIRKAEKLLYIMADPVTDQWLLEANPTAEDIHRFYADNKRRDQTYDEMRDYMLSFVRQGLFTCVALYGHPGVFATPAHAAIQLARAEGYEARMLPGISAEDCLFADLGVDPGETGCQSFEATDFLLYERLFDPYCALILWQIGAIGHLDYQSKGFDTSKINVLVDHLLQFYPPTHPVVLYESATHVLFEPRIEATTLTGLRAANITAITTLYVQSLGVKPHSRAMYIKLGLPESFRQDK